MTRPWLALLSMATTVVLAGSPARADSPLDLVAAANAARFDGTVHSIVLYQDTIIAAGTFKRSGNTAVGCIARWDGTTWRPLETQYPGGVGVEAEGYPPWISTLLIYDDKLVVGGRFDRIGGLDATHIAAWDGEGWSTLDEGVNNRVIDLFEWAGYLVAGGVFTSAGSNTAKHIAYWDGDRWFGFAEGLNGGVQAITEYKGNLIAGGAFTQTGDGIPVWRIAQWDAHAWRSLGSSSSGLFDGDPVTLVFDLVVHDDQLVVAGSFTRAGQEVAHKIARWDGATWDDFDIGFSSTVPFGVTVGTLVEYRGRLIAGGNFTKASGNGTRYIAWWNGAVWQPIGAGMDNSVWALYPCGDALLAGGQFQNAWQQPRGGLAVWSDPLEIVSTLVSGLAGTREHDGVHIDLRLGQPEGCVSLQLFRGTTGASPDTPHLVAVGPSQTADEPNARWLDDEAPTTALEYWVSVVNCAGESSWHGPVSIAAATTAVLTLSPSHPNPFAITTEFRYSLTRSGHVQLSVFDVRGRRIRNLVGSNQPAGSYRSSWNGANENGGSVPAGVYFIRLETEGQQRTRKVLLRP